MWCVKPRCSLRADDRIRVQHMIDAGEAIAQFVAGRTRADLDGDQMLLFAVVRALEILGEAASKVTAESRNAAPLVPWPAIVGMRNRIIHAYFDIDYDIVWQAATVEVPVLVRGLRTLVSDR
jgi:uncharacterized protein with HEPN domain